MFLSESRIGITNFEISYISTNRFPNQMYQYKNNSLLQFYSCKETLQSDFLPYEHVQRETRSSLYANIYDFFHLSTLTFRLIFFSPALPPRHSKTSQSPLTRQLSTTSEPSKRFNKRCRVT